MNDSFICCCTEQGDFIHKVKICYAMACLLCHTMHSESMVLKFVVNIFQIKNISMTSLVVPCCSFQVAVALQSCPDIRSVAFVQFG